MKNKIRKGTNFRQFGLFKSSISLPIVNPAIVYQLPKFGFSIVKQYFFIFIVMGMLLTLVPSRLVSSALLFDTITLYTFIVFANVRRIFLLLSIESA